MMHLRIRHYFIPYIRGFFLQCLWNFQRQQNVGFLFMIKPFLDLYYKGEQKKEAYLRHLEFFNTQPYMAGIIVALVAKTEKEIAEGNTNLIATLSPLKQSMASPLAAIGDSFFWGTLRPLCAMICIFIAILLAGISPELLVSLGIGLPLIFLFVYNLFHLAMRYFFMMMAFVFGQETLSSLARPHLRIFWAVLKLGAFIISMASTVVYLIYFGWLSDKASFFEASIIDFSVFSLGFVLSIFFAKSGFIIKIYTLLAFCILWSYLGA
jgi:PTS system mannose-specific IID component